MSNQVAVKISQVEKVALTAVLTSDYHDGVQVDARVGNPVWSDCLQVSVGEFNRHQVAGSLASLLAKGLLIKPNSETVAITLQGLVALALEV